MLVVDDNRDSRYLLRAMVEAQGHRVIEAGDGLKALELARQEHPFLILMDLYLPIMDGLEATRRLKKDPTLSDIPVVAITGLWGPEEALRAGCADYISKPVDSDALDQVLRALAIA